MEQRVTRGDATRGGPATTRQLLDLLPGRWCLLRPIDEHDDEYDVLVDGDAAVVARTLTEAGARPVRSWGRRPHRQYTWWDPSAQRPVRLDLVDELSFGPERELVIDVRDEVLEGVEERCGMPRPARSSEQWLALLHGLLDRDHLRPVDLARLTPWHGRDDDVVARLLPEPVRRSVAAAVRSPDAGALAGCRADVRAALERRQRVAAALRRAWRRTARRTVKLQRALLRPGCRVALLGPDGAGKSTTIAALQDAGVITASVYLGVAPASERRPTRVPGVALARTMARLAGAWATATVRRRRGDDVALDRHPLETEIGPPTTKTTTRVRRWLLGHMLPRPEVTVVLVAPPEVLHARKPEHDLSDAQARHDRYLDLASRHGFPVVDTSRPVADVVADIGRIVHDHGRSGRETSTRR